MADSEYLRSLTQKMRALAENCFDRRAAAELRALADKIDEDITLGIIVMGRPRDVDNKER